MNAINSIQINGNDISNIYVSSNVISNYLLPYDKIIDRQNAITALSNTLQTNINNDYSYLTTNFYNKTTIDNSLAFKQNN